MRNLLFDLDGTLTDPAVGITTCLRHALREVGASDLPALDDLRRYIGPPLRVAFAELLATKDDARIDTAIAFYRDRFAPIGMYENRVYPGVPAMLERLREAGHRIWVATSKPTVYAKRIVEHFELADSFEKVYGSQLSGEHADKVELVAHILQTEGLDPSDTLMIGDRMHDIVGGRRNGTGTLGVLWGFGSRQELTDAAPDGLAESTGALVDWVSTPGTNPRARSHTAR